MRKIFGHRGLPHSYEENTFKSLNKAQEICDFVETDVRITKDEELVLYHDAEIQTQKIEELSLSDINELIDIEISEIHLISRKQIKGNTNFELKISSKDDDLNKVFLKKIINLTNPEDIVSSFDWEIILNNRESFKSKYGILIDKENQLFESKAMSNLDEKLMFMVEKEIFYSRNFDLPLERCVVWTVNDKGEINSVLNMNVYGVVNDLSTALKEAMKAKDKPKLDAIRQIQTEIAKKKSEKGEEVNDELVLGVISSYVKKMAKAVDEYKSLGEKGEEMANKIQFEIDFLTTYLPEQLSEEEVEKIVDDVLAELGDVDMSQMGRVIGAVMAKGDGIDGSIVSKIVKGKLN